MFYTFSKFLSALIWPSTVISVLLLAGAAMVLAGRWAQWGRRALIGGLVLLLACGFGPVGNWLLLPLEQRFERGQVPPRIAGVIMLGGFEVPNISRARGQLSMNEAAERLTEGVRLALAYPLARVVFTGGEATMLGGREGAVGPVGDYLEAMGIARTRIVLEGRSRTTYENALFLKDLLEPQPGERYVLVTSAYHMPRSVGTFRRLGFDVVAWPVDYRTLGYGGLWSGFDSIPGGLKRVDEGFKEWIGLVAYRLSGRSTALWPGADQAAASPAKPAGSAVSAPAQGR